MSRRALLLVALVPIVGAAEPSSEDTVAVA